MTHAFVRRCQIVILGDANVGKTAIVHRLTEDEFRADCRATLGVEFSLFEQEIDGCPVNLLLIDTPGDLWRTPLIEPVKRQADACVIVFDVTQRQSFENIDLWRQLFVTNDQGGAPLPCVVFASKCEIGENAREVMMSQARESLTRKGLELFEVSATDGQNIEEGFRCVAAQFFNCRTRNRFHPQTTQRRWLKCLT